jgi:hypothetical protein
MQGAVPPAPAIVPSLSTQPSSAMTVLTSMEEMRSACNQVASSAQRLISIYTQDFEPQLYDHSEFLGIIKRFVLGRNFAKVRVVLTDGSKLLRDGNRFVGMARRLTSYIDIRIMRVNVPQHAASYIIADDRAIVLRARPRTWEGIANFNHPPIARTHLAEFEAVWSANQPEPVTIRAGAR